jgi:hypothetical protein
MQADGSVGRAADGSRQRLECVRFHRRFGGGAPAAAGRTWAYRSDGKAVLQAHAVQTLARPLARHSEPMVFVILESRDESSRFEHSRPLGLLVIEALREPSCSVSTL